MKHPIHPIIVHFPVSAWILSTVGDIVSLSANEQVGWAAGVLLIIGTITALFAMATGLVELGKIDQKNDLAAKIANQHMLLMMASWSFYTTSLFLRLNGTTLEPPGGFAIFLSVIGCFILCFAGWLGGKLVYEHGIGVRSQNS